MAERREPFSPTPTQVERFWARVDRRGSDECWPWAGPRRPKGYGLTDVFGRTAQTHRIAYLLAMGHIPAGLFVCHRCDNPPCCNPAHLFVGSPKDNTWDMRRKGRGNAARLSPGDIQAIRNRVAAGELHRDVAAGYGLKYPTAFRDTHLGRIGR